MRVELWVGRGRGFIGGGDSFLGFLCFWLCLVGECGDLEIWV